jgi:hypothetical protein
MSESLSVEADSVHNVALLRIRGALTYGHQLTALRDACSRLSSTVWKRDSSGFSALLTMKQILHDTEVVLLCPSDHVRITLETMRVAGLFAIARTDLDLQSLDDHPIPPVGGSNPTS